MNEDMMNHISHIVDMYTYDNNNPIQEKAKPQAIDIALLLNEIAIFCLLFAWLLK